MKRKSIVILAALMLVIPITSSAEPQSGDGNANISSSLAVDSAVGTFGSLSAARIPCTANSFTYRREVWHAFCLIHV